MLQVGATSVAKSTQRVGSAASITESDSSTAAAADAKDAGHSGRGKDELKGSGPGATAAAEESVDQSLSQPTGYQRLLEIMTSKQVAKPHI